MLRLGSEECIKSNMVGLTSAAGVVGFLYEPDPALQTFALQRLNDEIDSVWTEVSGSIGQMYVHHIFRGMDMVIRHMPRTGGTAPAFV